MTDDELVSGLLSAIEQAEKEVNDCIADVGSDRVGDEYADGSGTADRDDFPSYPWGSDDRELAFMAGAGHPDSVLRLCRAHRKMIELYEGAVRVRNAHPDHAANQGYLWALEHTLKALKVGYGLTEEDSDG